MTPDSPILCTNCKRPYPEDQVVHRCPVCGGIYYYSSPPLFSKDLLAPGLPGIWRYRRTFPIPEGAPVVSLGEGNTSLEWREVSGHRAAFKLEYLNPTGSFKDRGSAVLSSFLLSRGIEAAVEDSSGNAGASFAAYAAHAGIQSRVFIPDSTSAAKRNKIEKYGAEVVRIMGPRSNASEAVLHQVSQGATYASHAYLPAVLAGYATIAYESVEQMGGPPGTVITPVGQGNLLLGLLLGYQAMQQAGVTDTIPVPIGVQALACAPIWAVFRYGTSGMGWVTESPTVAEGVRVRFPARGDMVLSEVLEHNGRMIAVDEPDILSSRDQLASLGFYVEPTSAIAWQALQEVIGKVPDPVLVVLTGAGSNSP